MAGFLDDLMNPANQGALNLAAGFMQAGAPSQYPVPFGAALGRGLMAGMQGVQAAQQAALQQKMLELHGALYGAQAGKLNEDIRRQQRLAQIMSGGAGVPAPQPIGVSDSSAAGASAPWAAASQIPQPAVSQLEPYKAKASQLAKEGFLQEANQLAEFVTKMEPKLEFKDGVWYDKVSGAPVRGGAGVNQQGFGYQTTLGPNGQISLGVLPGAADVYGQQQNIGEQARAAHDLVIVPPTGPNVPPAYASRASLLPSVPSAMPPSTSGAPAAPAPAPTRPAAGMSPAATAAQAAAAEQQKNIAVNYGTIYNELQNAAMTNPAKIANFQRIGTLLGDYEGGKLSKTSFELARLGNSLGIQIDKNLPNKEAAESLSSQVALELRNTGQGGGMPGSMSNQDRDYLKGMTPNMAQTAPGRRTIIETRVKLMQRESEVAGFARNYLKKYGKIDAGFSDQLQSWADAHPLFK